LFHFHLFYVLVVVVVVPDVVALLVEVEAGGTDEVVFTVVLNISICTSDVQISGPSIPG